LEEFHGDPTNLLHVVYSETVKCSSAAVAGVSLVEVAAEFRIASVFLTK
jgi:hypothetical protein